MCLAGPSCRQDVRLIEIVRDEQKKCVRSLVSTSNEDRLKYLKLPTLVYRHVRSDMMLTYKLQNKKSAIFGGNLSTSSTTQEDTPRSYQSQATDRKLAKHSVQEVINRWNQLKDSTVNAPSIQSLQVWKTLNLSDELR